MTRRWVVPAALFGLALAGASVFIAAGEWIEARVHPEVFKVLAELVLLLGIGGVASFVIDGLNRAREQRGHIKERMRTELSDLVTAYNDVKSIRRRLRAEAIRPDFEDPAAVVYGSEYAALLQRLNDAELEIEAHRRLIDGNRDLYADPQVLFAELGTAERYLGKLISEWEDNLGKFQGSPSQLALAGLPFLRCFVGDPGMGFGSSFSDPMHKVFAILGRPIST